MIARAGMNTAQRYLLTVAMLTVGLTVGWLFATIAYADLGYAGYRLHVPLFGDLALIGLLNSVAVLAGGLSGPPAWQAVRSLGARAALILGCLLHSLALLTLSLAPAADRLSPLTAWLLLAGVALSGPASVLFNLAGPPLMMQLSGAAGPDRLFARSAALTLITNGAASLLGGQLTTGWRWLFSGSTPIPPYQLNALLSTLVVILAALPLVGLRVQPLPTATVVAGNRSFNAFWRAIRQGLVFVPGPLLISLGAALFIPYLSLFFRQRFAASDTIIGLLLALISLTTGLATLLGPRLAARFGRLPAVVLTQALAIPCLVALAFAPTLPLAALIAIVRGMLMNMATPLFEAEALAQAPPAHHATVTGMIRAAASVGYIAGPTLSAELQATAGFTTIFLIAALCYTAAVLVNAAIVVGRRSSHHSGINHQSAEHHR
jgi:MFS family permease